MSKRSRSLKNARRGLSGRPVAKVRGPADTLALVPYLLGFVPAESIVVIAVERPARTFGPMFRLDLPVEADRAAAAGDVSWFVRRHAFDEVVVAIYSAVAAVADPFATVVLERLRSEQVRVNDAFRGDGRRWWSYVCVDPLCCPPEGTEYDVDTSPAAAGAVVAGLVKAPDREALREQFQPGAPEARREVAAEVSSLQAGAVPLLSPDGMRAVLPRVLAGSLAEPREQAHLLLSLTLIPQRDEAWGAIGHDNAGRYFEAWRRLMRLAPDGLIAPVGSLTAFSAWLSGRGVLASHAAERVLEVQPDYSMALLIMRALETGLSPHEWSGF